METPRFARVTSITLPVLSEPQSPVWMEPHPWRGQRPAGEGAALAPWRARALAQPMLHPGPTALTDSRDLPWSFLQHVGQYLPVHPDPALSSLPPSLTCPSTMGTEGGRTPSARHCPMVPTSISPEGSILLLPGRHLKPSQLQVCVNRQNVPGAFRVGNPTRGPGRPSERKGLAKSTEQLGFPGSWGGLGKGGANGQDYL